MNKYKKIAMSAVAVVMAGTMMVPLAACKTNRTPSNKKTYSGMTWDKAPELADDLTPNLDSNGRLAYDANTKLVMRVGNKNTTSAQGISYLTTDLGEGVTMPDGKTYQSGKLKPAWQALGETLNITFEDQFRNSDNPIADLVPTGAVTIQNYDVITTSMAEINQYGSQYLLDLDDYIYYMPNYKAFLKANPVTVFSLNGNAQTGAMYAAPYFDGNDSIEYYEMTRRDWVEKILDGDMSGATTTFKAQATAKQLTGNAEATSYMGTTGSWTIETTNPGNTSATLTVTVDYNAALTAAKNASTGLGKAISDAAGKTYTGDSGNIVDLQNFAITETGGAVTANQLATILREYIKVTYKDGSKAFYDGQKYSNVTTKLSDVFNSSYAAWDVDLLVGMLRCLVTSANVLDTGYNGGLTDSQLYGIMARQSTTQRRTGLYGLAGELYGIRGMDSRYEMTYLDADGEIQDNRLDPDTYTLLNRMSALSKEGILYNGTDGTDGRNSYNYNGKTVAAMTHDYSQTQSRFAITDTMPEGYDFAPIVTPVSKWDVDGDGERTDIMRFTESWRSVKNTGFCIPVDAVKGNANKLSAVLAFIDYLFSTDGQLLMTFGPQSTNGNSNPNGWWYANKSTQYNLNTVADLVADSATNYCPAQYTVKDEYKDKCFVYKGEVYEGTAPAGENVPIMTDANTSFYKGETVNGYAMGTTAVVVSAKGSYTNYARYILGTTLPIGNKNQGFEAQATAACAVAGQQVVATAINNKTIKHVKINVDENESLWYLITPTMLPTVALYSSDASQKLISGTYFVNSSSTYVNVYLDIMFYGLGDTSHYICGDSNLGTLKEDGNAYIAWLNTIQTNKQGALDARLGMNQDAWYLLDKLYGITGRNAD